MLSRGKGTPSEAASRYGVGLAVLGRPRRRQGPNSSDPPQSH